MNCDAAGEKLIELVYDELPDADRQALEAHVASCPACREELSKLRLARSALAEVYAGEPAVRPWAVPADEPRARRLVFPAGWRRWVGAAAGVAAAAAITVAVVLYDRTVPTASAQPKPVAIERVGVSLTILSAPEHTGGSPGRFPAVQQRLCQMAQSEERIGAQGCQVTCDPGAFRPSLFANWRGLALVRDQRLIRHLPRGQTQVRFREVPSGILPDSVRLRSLTQPGGLNILEQNYQYDLASAAAVLKRHVDQEVTAVFKDGRVVRGTLLSFDDGALVIRPAAGGPRNLARQELRGIGFARLPEGLLTRPTLMWMLDNQAASKQQLEVAYLTRGLTWRADYVLKLRPAERGAFREAGGKRAADAGIPEILDAAGLVGYATVNNLSGVSYADAQLKLLAGDVNLICPPGVTVLQTLEQVDLCVAGVPPPMQEKAFFEYHLYTLTRPTTIRDAETKQLQMVSAAGVRLRRAYVYDPQANATAVRVVSELDNSEANGLGKPLPKGVVRLYAPDPEGLATYVAKTTIDHTPKNEKLRLPWGYAFDLVASAKQTAYRRRGTDYSATWRVQLRNHKDHGVNVTVVRRLPPSTYEAKCTHRWHVREVGRVEIDVPVKANAAADVELSYRWNPASGGGLKSPHDE